ncbi:hypothetical protein ZYGR_0AF02480 [Zygosaccharomyces rouxii]|uniref:Cysteine protease RIM13 n=1 Tax=Zygosaccharomyces rouxii TaxID=4956 RepID=A0A1Q3A7Y8_ZYGRO|nr:hypothetical protein ZYGR_0AF02480 [Zygosaccharomyces rouxii]
MDDWRLLNELRRLIYLDNGLRGREQDLNRLVSVASKSNDMEMIKSVLLLKEDSDSLSPKQKLLWLTSKLRERVYPPLAVDIAGPLPWNDDLSLSNTNSHYCYERPLKCDLGIPGLSQCRDLENCSFIASLISMKNQRIPHPKIRQVNDHLYHVNLHFNGCDWRLVSVDSSKVPTDEKGCQLSLVSDHIVDKIVEMAYLQVKSGSYATTGSNTAMDTFLLTGYVPEVKALDDISSMQEIIGCYKSGKCLLALGTGQHPNKLDEPLIGNHDYPVIDVDLQHGIIALQDPLDPSLCLQTNLDTLIGNYQQLYINWRTDKLFAFEKTLEFFYNREKCDKFNTVMNKQLFFLENGSDSEQNIWLLLESHLQAEKSIAYLQELPKDVLSSTSSPHVGACDIGLNLLKLKMDARSSKKIFCHSSTSNAFTIRLYSNSPSVNIGRLNADKCSKALECKVSNLEQCFMGSPFYYKNPTFQLEIVHHQAKQFPLNLQLLSENFQDMVNLQIYHLKDHSLERPILADPNYTPQRYDKAFVPFSTNVPYKLVCSSYSNKTEHSYRLQISPSDDQLSLSHIQIKQIHIQFGGLPFQLERRIPCNENKLIFPFATSTKTTCFIRVVPPTFSSLLRMSLNVCDEYGASLCGTQFSQSPAPGGIVIDNWKSMGPAQYFLVIDTNGPKSDCSSFYLTVCIGSSKKITINERYC